MDDDEWHAFLEEFDIASLRRLDLQDAIYKLRQQRQQWRSEMASLHLQVRQLSTEVFYECQELLQLFGVPYVVSPFEADSQCAFLSRHGLVDGVISEDSDMFVFGCSKVYRRFFNSSSIVQEYDSHVLQDALGLDQEKMVELALLLGSDYTDGIHNVGIVTAMEIVSCFDSLKSLETFRQWVDRLLTGSGSRSSAADTETWQTHYGQATEAQREFMKRFSEIGKRFVVHDDRFPNQDVVHAYTTPAADPSLEPFSWKRPDPALLVAYCREVFGWEPARTLRYLEPLLQRRATLRQDDIRKFLRLKKSTALARIRSKRLFAAVARLTGGHTVLELAHDSSADAESDGDDVQVASDTGLALDAMGAVGVATGSGDGSDGPAQPLLADPGEAVGGQGQRQDQAQAVEGDDKGPSASKRRRVAAVSKGATRKKAAQLNSGANGGTACTADKMPSLARADDGKAIVAVGGEFIHDTEEDDAEGTPAPIRRLDVGSDITSIVGNLYDQSANEMLRTFQHLRQQQSMHHRP